MQQEFSKMASARSGCCCSGWLNRPSELGADSSLFEFEKCSDSRRLLSVLLPERVKTGLTELGADSTLFEFKKWEVPALGVVARVG